jgi:NADH:ubiquinone oxidoreductase subunit F (NADH-binding)/NADH:ubiquinone oxidoreductase subunit E
MSLIAELTRLQAERGHLSDDDLKEVSERLRVPLYRIQEVVSFYPRFRRSPAPASEVLLCRDLSCFLAGGEAWGARVRHLLGRQKGVEVKEASCLGRCDRAPAAMVNGAAVGAVPPEEVARRAERPQAHGEGLPTPRRWRLDPYAPGDERFTVFHAWAGRPEEVIAALKAAGLRGMGGAGFQTGLKWELVRKETRAPKYVVVNADESEPGTFKDRALLEEAPHLVIEGMCLGARVVGATEGWIYLRHEYEHALGALERALAAARGQGLLEGFDVEIFLSPGGYILGEETALLEALEDRRGEPRNKPPYPGSHGLRGQPTLINNVETFAMVPAILARGADWWKAQGVRGHAGLKVMAVSGDVERPGVYEIPMGTTVAELIAQAGGVRGGGRLKAFAPGGASSAFLPADRAEAEIDFASIQAAGSMLGSGALVVVAEGQDLLRVAHNVVRFFRNESCGKCVPCRNGTEKVVAMLEEVLAGKGDGRLRQALPDLEVTLAQTSICGLGQVALNPLTSVLKAWPEVLDR